MPFLLLFLLSSCGLWDSATAYFNTFYNAKRLFEDAEDELWAQKDVQQLGRDYYLATFASVNKTKFTQVIEKCSKLLQYHPESNLVDDALLLIGMSSYYTGDYQQADRKFRELLDHDPGRTMLVRGGIMLAYTEYRLTNRDSAAAIAGRMLEAATNDGDDAAIGQTSILLGQIEKDRDNRSAARQHFLKAGETADNPELRTTAYLAAARLAEELSDYAGAESACRSAEEASQTYAGEFRGQLGIARMRAMQGDYAAAFERLRELSDNQNYKEFFPEISYEIGNVYRLSGDIPQAVTQYFYVDTAFARTEFAAKAAYERGLLYETKLQNLDSARVAYTRGKNHGTTAPVGELLTRKADLLTAYIRYRTDLRRQDSTRSAWVARRDSLLALKDSLGKIPILSRPGSPDSVAAGKDTVIMPAISPRTMKLDTLASQRDSLDRNAVAAKPEVRDSIAAGKDSLARKTVPSKPPQEVPPAAARLAPLPNIDSLDNQIASTQVELATLFYTGMGRPDSARFWYRIFLQDHPGHPGVPRALYTLAQITSQDSTSPRGESDSLYHALVEKYPMTVFADEARKVLRMPPVKHAKGDAEEAYDVAAGLILDGKYDEAVTALRKITAAFPGSPLAARAQYAIGWLYENQMNSPDSATANYQLLVSRYPASSFAPLVQPKLQAVQTARAGVQADTTKSVARKDTVAVQKPAPQELPSNVPGSGRRARQQSRRLPGRE